MQEKKPAGADLNMSGEYNHQNRWGTERSKIQLSQSLGKKIKGTRCPGNEEYQKVSKQTDRHSLHVRNNALMSCNEKEKSKAKEIKWSKKSSQRLVSRILFSVFSCRNFMASGLVIKSLIYFELIFVNGVS